MQFSDIVVSRTQPPPTKEIHCDKLRQAYLDGRRATELTDIELNRSKIIIVDALGTFSRFSLFSEH